MANALPGELAVERDPAKLLCVIVFVVSYDTYKKEGVQVVLRTHAAPERFSFFIGPTDAHYRKGLQFAMNTRRSCACFICLAV